MKNEGFFAADRGCATISFAQNIFRLLNSGKLFILHLGFFLLQFQVSVKYLVPGQSLAP